MRRVPADISSMPFDAIIIGAGVNGCGVARDRGALVLTCARVERLLTEGGAAREVGGYRRQVRRMKAEG